jgi:hypothetical protein
VIDFRSPVNGLRNNNRCSLGLTEAQIDDRMAFLEALSSPEYTPAAGPAASK